MTTPESYHEYHHKLGLPSLDSIHLPNDRWDLRPSHHAIEEANNDEYGDIDLPDVVALSGYEGGLRWDNDEGIAQRVETGSVTEIAVNSKTRDVWRVSIRTPYDDDHDLNTVVNLLWENCAGIITVWLNENDDYPDPNKRDYKVPKHAYNP